VRPTAARPFRPRVWWSAAALAAVLAATVGLVVFLQGGRGAGPSTEQLASLVGPVAPLQVPWGRRMRGGTSSTEQLPELPPEHEEFLLGVRFLDLRLALASGERDDAAYAATRLLQLLDRMDVPPPEVRAAYGEIRKQVPQAPLPALLAAAAAAEKKAMEELVEDPRLVELGRWTEACQLVAGKNGRTDLFRRPATLRVLDEAMRPGGKDASTLDPQSLAIVRSIREEIASGRIHPATLGERCTDLLNHLANDDQ
jgi:hypothetical protein